MARIIISILLILFSFQSQGQIAMFHAHNQPATYQYLLDDYPGASAAYSLRKLRSAYAGSAIRVRRSSDNTETDIGFVNNLLDTASLKSFVGANDGFVTTWYDQSGSGNNAVQATAANQPRVIGSGVVDRQNTKPSIFFDGTSDYFLTTISNTTNTLTGFYITNKSAAGSASLNANSRIAGYAKTGESDFNTASGLAIAYNRTGFAYTFRNSVTLNNKAITYGSLNIITVTNDGTNSKLKYNNTVELSVANSASFNYNRIAIGNAILIGGAISTADYLNGYYSEFVIYHSNQSANNASIQLNINTYYSIY